jgi:hypothetical protein
MIGRKKSESTNASAYAQLKAMAERQETMQNELSALAAAVKSLEARLAERNDEPEFSAAEGAVEVLDAGGRGAAPARRRSVKVEVKAVIAAAAAAAGEIAKARKISALPASQDAGSAWSQQGRVGVVSSHNLR